MPARLEPIRFYLWVRRTVVYGNRMAEPMADWDLRRAKLGQVTGERRLIVILG